MNIKGVVIHHSASDDVSANEINRWHKNRGWNGIGYHFVVRQSGLIEPAREWSIAGAHKKGYNDTHLGICATGNFTKEYPTNKQIDSLIMLVGGILNRNNGGEILQHHSNCPGPNFPWKYFIKNIRR